MKMTIIIKCLFACFISAIITAPAYSESGFYSKYSTIRADIVGIRDATSGKKWWSCTSDAFDYCDLSQVNKENNVQITGTTSNFSYDGDGVNNGNQGTIHVEINQPSIYNPFQLENFGIFKRGGKWLDSFNTLINQGRLTVDLANGEDNLHAKLWFLHMNIKVNLGSLGNEGWFSSGIYQAGYGEIIILIRLMPQVINSIHLEEEFTKSGFNAQEHELGNLFFGPHMVEAARVKTDGRFGPNKSGTSGVKWNSGTATKLSYNPAEAWGFPLTDKELARIHETGGSSSDESVGLTQHPRIKKSWFNRPVYFSVQFDHLQGGNHKRMINGKKKTVWVSPSTQIDAIIHTYIIGDWKNKPVDTVETTETETEIKVDDSFLTQLKNGFGLFEEMSDIYHYLKGLALFFITSVALLVLNWLRLKLKSDNPVTR